MANPFSARNAGAAAAFLAVLAGGYYLRSPAGAHATLYTVHADSAALAQIRALAQLDGGAVALHESGADAGSGYYLARVCALTAEGEAAALPSGITPVPSSEQAGEDCPTGSPVVEVWPAEHPAAPFACACSPAPVVPLPGVPLVPACEWRMHLIDGTAPWRSDHALRVHRPGDWRGASCVRTPCVELAGSPSYPEACRQ